MSRASLVLIALVLLPGLAYAASLGSVVKVLRPELRTFDDKGQPTGMLEAADLKVPAPIVAIGVGGSFGVNHGGKVVFLRGLDVQTQGVNAVCTPVQSTNAMEPRAALLLRATPTWASAARRFLQTPRPVRPSRRTFAFALATAALAAQARPARALGGDDAFSVSGKPGPFIKQVSARDFAAAAAGEGSMGLADANAGQYQAARLRMPQTEAGVAKLLASLDDRWPYAKGQPLQVHILGVDYYNAYSLPDGSIVVAFGLLDGAQSDDEVAFVLAHELGHVRLGHFAKIVEPQQPNKLPSQLGQLFLVGGAAASAAGGAADQAGATNAFLHFLTGVTAEPGHTRNQEDEADCIGYDLSQQDGYSADSASARVFDTIQADQLRRKALTDILDDQLKKQLSEAVNPSTAMSFLTGGMGGMRSGLHR